MKKNLVCLDTETTGLNFQSDSIIQLAMIKVDSTTFEQIDSRNWYILPEGDFVIQNDAMEKHHITKEMLIEKGVNLRSIYKEFIEFIKDCDLLTYNGESFDIQMITNNFERYGLEVDWSNIHSYDAYYIEAQLMPRTLEAVYERRVGHKFENAHNAFSDVAATIEVFKNQLNDFDLTQFEKENNTEIISPEHSIMYLEDKLVFTRGKYSRKDVYEICVKDSGYIKWFFDNIASKKTKEEIKKYFYSKKQNS